MAESESSDEQRALPAAQPPQPGTGTGTGTGTEIKILISPTLAMHIATPPGMPSDIALSFLQRAADFFRMNMTAQMAASEVSAILEQQAKEARELARLGLKR